MRCCLKKLTDIPVFRVSDFVSDKEYDHSVFITESRDAECYCIHSSGTTGQPKGIILDEEGLVNCILHTNERMNITSDDACIAVTNFCHDMAVYDITGMLSAGGTVVFPDGDAEEKDPDAWLDLIKKYHVTVWNSCPSVMEMLLTEGDALECLKGQFKLIILGGEVFTAKLAAQLRDTLSPIQLYNAGGPAEATIWSILHPVTDHDIEYGIIPYGRSVPGNCYVVMDENMCVCPPGVEGIMYIRGAGVAEGYCGLPEETAKRFIMHKGVRYYDTGDVGWYFPDGLIVFGGRKDQQIEINGKRVELEGIASIIEDFEGIEKCEAVVPACNERIIAAFYTSASQIDTEKLKEHTEGLLPRYMHPSAYIRLDSFPHIFNGKVDINKLRKYEIVQEPAEERELTAAEKIILDICRDILTNTDGLVSGESFYRCGGNSLDAIKLISRIRKKTGKSITLAQFLQRPYLFAWAELIGEDAKHQENAADAKRKADIFRKPGMPLSQEQESMWLYENVNHNTRYVLSASLKLNEEISIERLCAAAADYVRSEPVLNAVFVKNENGDLLQRYADNTHGDIVKAVAVSDEELARNFIKMYADMPMDLERGPLYRFMLYETGKNSFIFNISIHHIIADEQSFIMAFKNIMSRYRSKPVRSNNGGDFFDYILLKKNEPDTEEECWKELENAGTLGKIAAPDETGPDVSDERIEIMLDMNRVKRLRNICSGQDVSLFAGFMSVWLYVLKEASDKERFSISVPMSDRNVGDFGSAFGMFIKKVLLTADVKKGQPFSRTLSVVHEGMLKASTQMKHSFAPYVRRNGLSAHMNSLYTDVMLNFIDSGSDTGYGKLEYVMDKKDVGANNLQLLAELTDESCKCSFYYNEEVYSKREAAYIAALWERMFTKVADGPDLSLPSVIKAEICDNGSESIIERFLLWAERTPDADAIADSEGTVSYAELRRSVFRFAERLSCEGIKSGDNVAVFCVQDRDTIALIYALFVLGAVYVPIDRDMPEERAEYITARCDCRMIVSAENIPYDMHDANVRKIQMKDDGRSASEEKTPIKDLSRIAYIIFTSGTTGRPKGVPIEEQWLINMCCFYSSAFNIDASSRSIMVNNYSFDGSLKTIFTPLISGGCFVAGPKIAFDVAEAADIIKRERITHLAAIPSLLKAIIQVSAEGGYSALDSVKWTISAGEKFRCAEFCEWSRSSSFGSRLANMYGPAECSCIVTACEVTPEQLESGEIPIGEPIRNKRVYLLDETGYPCDIGETGHIWIAGFGTFSGYIGASADESGLVRDIFGNGNMYRSGDMGRLRSDGSIVYAGRCDNQIKISGQRVEAEEMENVMEQFSGVHECILKQFTGGAEQYTVMFYTADSKIDVTEMREYLGRYFNKGVLPNEFVQLDSFPLNKNGKIDRSKLCEPKARPAEERTDTQPVSETEEKIRCIWCRLLRRESVPLNEDFFRLGGYSMLLYKCQSELEREFSASFPMRELLKYTTIRELAAYARSVSDLSHPTDNEKPERAETSKAMIRKRRRNE